MFNFIKKILDRAAGFVRSALKRTARFFRTALSSAFSTAFDVLRAHQAQMRVNAAYRKTFFTGARTLIGRFTGAFAPVFLVGVALYEAY